jgi:septal ring factor EnvC (AmiA/AmiB activator)
VQESRRFAAIKTAVVRRLLAQNVEAAETHRQLEAARKELESLRQERDTQQSALTTALQENASLAETNARLIQDLQSKSLNSFFCPLPVVCAGPDCLFFSQAPRVPMNA